MVICISQTYLSVLFVCSQIQNRIKRCGKPSKINISELQNYLRQKKHRIQMIWTRESYEKPYLKIKIGNKLNQK